VIVLVWSICRTDAVLRGSEISFGEMSGMFAHERKDPKNLGNKKYSDNPWT